MTTPVIPKILVPPNLDIKSSTDELTITYRWWSVWYSVVAMFALICNGYYVYLAFLELVLGVDVDWSALILILLGLVAAYFALTGWFNRTTIRVTPSNLQVTYGPLPYFGSINLPTDQIDQLYVADVFTKYGRRTSGYHYELRVQLNNDSKDKTLIKELTTPLNALYLEQEIEHYLGIKDKIVPREEPKNTHQYAQRLWQAIAQAHDLDFIPGKRPETMIISGTYQGHTLGLSVFREKYPRGVLSTRLVLAADSSQAAKTHPTPRNVIRLMNQINETVGSEQRIHIKGNGQEITYEAPGIETGAKQLIYLFDSFGDLLDAYPYLASLGGEAIVTLKEVATDKTHQLNALAGQWIEAIAPQTHPLQAQASRLVCQLCMVRCTDHQVELSALKRVTFFGCRECFQSRDFYEADTVVAVLDTHMGAESQDGTTLRVNWLKHGTLFDFDNVEIISATDQDVERFAVQLGNDTLPARAPSYKQMACIIASSCHLSDNTLRILDKTFGHVGMRK